MLCPWLPGSVIMVLLPFLSLLHGNRAEGHNPRLSAVQAFSGLGRHVFRFEVVAMIYDKITTMYYSKAILLFLPRAGVSNGCNPRISFLVSGVNTVEILAEGIHGQIRSHRRCEDESPKNVSGRFMTLAPEVLPTCPCLSKSFTKAMLVISLCYHINFFGVFCKINK